MLIVLRDLKPIFELRFVAKILKFYLVDESENLPCLLAIPFSFFILED